MGFLSIIACLFLIQHVSNGCMVMGVSLQCNCSGCQCNPENGECICEAGKAGKMCDKGDHPKWYFNGLHLTVHSS